MLLPSFTLLSSVPIISKCFDVCGRSQFCDEYSRRTAVQFEADIIPVVRQTELTKALPHSVRGVTNRVKK